MSRLFTASRRTYDGSLLLALGLACLLFPVCRAILSRNEYAVLAALLIWMWMTLLFVSGAHVCQGKTATPLGAGAFIVCLSVILSGFWLLVFYPGVMSHDAISQWGQALHNRYSRWHPPILAMLMHVTQCCAQGPSLFSFLEGVLFWGSTFYLIRQVTANGRQFLAQCLVIMAVPPLWLYSNATVSNTWAAAFMMLSAAALIEAVRAGSRRHFAAAVAALAIAATFRREVVLLALLMIALDVLWFRRRLTRGRLILDALLIAVTVWLPNQLVDISPRVRQTGENPAGPGLLNQYVGTVVYAQPGMNESELRTEEQSIDDEFGAGTFRLLLDHYDCDSGDYIVWRRGKGAPILEKDKIRSRFAIGKVGRTALRHPLAFMRHQVCYASYLTQFEALDYETWGMVKTDRALLHVREAMGVALESKLPSIKERYAEAMQAMMADPLLTLLFRHYVWLVASVVVLIAGLRRRKVEWIIPALFSVAYPVSYLMAGPSPLWRYLLPSYAFSWIAIMAFVGSLSEHGANALESPKTTSGEPDKTTAA